MSIPPKYPPQNYGAAPPPRPSGVSGWKIAGFGCLALFVLAVLGIVLVGRAVKDQIAHPSKISPVGIGILAGKAGLDGVRLQQAVVAYHQAHGKYPGTLQDLVREGAVDGKTLHNDLDENPDPGHVSWQYTKPAEGAPGETPILEEPYQVTFGGTSQSSSIVITLNGRNQPKPAVQRSGAPAGPAP